MIKDVNKTFMLLIIVLMIAMVTLTIYHNNNYGTLKKRCFDLNTELQDTIITLELREAQLNTTLTELQQQLIREKELLSRYNGQKN